MIFMNLVNRTPIAEATQYVSIGAQRRKAGESERRLDLLPAWHEASCFSARERAALAWCESLTLVAESRVPDEVWHEARGQFSEEELMKLTMVVVINGWNRICIAFRSEVEGQSGPVRAGRSPGVDAHGAFRCSRHVFDSFSPDCTAPQGGAARAMKRNWRRGLTIGAGQPPLSPQDPSQS
jgi:hypothetical protein